MASAAHAHNANDQSVKRRQNDHRVRFLRPSAIPGFLAAIHRQGWMMEGEWGRPIKGVTRAARRCGMVPRSRTACAPTKAGNRGFSAGFLWERAWARQPDEAVATRRRSRAQGRSHKFEWAAVFELCRVSFFVGAHPVRDHLTERSRHGIAVAHQCAPTSSRVRLCFSYSSVLCGSALGRDSMTEWKRHGAAVAHRVRSYNR